MICEVRRCDAPVHCRRMCEKHYTRWYKHGDPLISYGQRGYDDSIQRNRNRFLSRALIDPSGCILWQGRLNEKGYGRIRWPEPSSPEVVVHRVAYEMFVEPIPQGLVLDHLCRVRHCVNPSHLEPVTTKENIRRGLRGVLREEKK